MATGDDNQETFAEETEESIDEQHSSIKTIQEDDEKTNAVEENIKQSFADNVSAEGDERKSGEKEVVSEPEVVLPEQVLIAQVSSSKSGILATQLESLTNISSETQTMRCEREKRVRLGHRRVSSDGQVTYKNIVTTRIVDSIRLGIEHVIAGSAISSDRDLLMQDFMTVESIPFSSSGLERFIFKSYAPIAFQHFRELFGIKPETYLASFCKNQLKELSGSGKSGSIFYLTEDDRFIIKTMQSKECSFLQKLLPGYFMNLHQNPDTLLPKYFGLYCYQCDSKKVKLVAMNNILPSSVRLSQRYDLKGATYKCRSAGVRADKVTPLIFKDLDFMAHHPTGLFLENDMYNALMETIKRDCTVLESFKIMDYSLLLGISKVDTRTSSREPQRTKSPSRLAADDKDGQHIDKKPSRMAFKRINSKETSHKSRLSQFSISHETDSLLFEGLPALDGDGKPLLLFIGIIDILQSYKLKKKFEHAWKSIFHDGDTVSVHKPGFYSTRFQKFMAEKVFKRLSSSQTKRKAVSKQVTPKP